MYIGIYFYIFKCSFEMKIKYCSTAKSKQMKTDQKLPFLFTNVILTGHMKNLAMFGPKRTFSWNFTTQNLYFSAIPI